MRAVLGSLVLLAALLVGAASRADAPGGPCQRAVARAGGKLAKSALKTFQHGALRALRGKVGADVTCGPDGGTPTGDRATDAAIAAIVGRRASARVAQSCSTADLSAFARRCSDPTGPPFTLADLVSCLKSTHLDRAAAMVDVEFPATAPVAQVGEGCTGTQTCKCECAASPRGALLSTSNLF